jgi:hypothetical protein
MKRAMSADRISPLFFHSTLAYTKGPVLRPFSRIRSLAVCFFSQAAFFRSSRLPGGTSRNSKTPQGSGQTQKFLPRF